MVVTLQVSPEAMERPPLEATTKKRVIMIRELPLRIQAPSIVNRTPDNIYVCMYVCTYYFMYECMYVYIYCMYLCMYVTVVRTNRSMEVRLASD
jgi:hypothetical protein